MKDPMTSSKYLWPFAILILKIPDQHQNAFSISVTFYNSSQKISLHLVSRHTEAHCKVQTYSGFVAEDNMVPLIGSSPDVLSCPLHHKLDVDSD